MALSDWLGSAVDGILGLFGLGNSAWNRKSQEDMNKANLDYAKAMTEKQWERDDNTYQRSVADATAAGFSPLAVLDGGLSPNGSPVGYQGQAPQFDINSVMNAVLSATNKIQESSENEKARIHDYRTIHQNYINEVDILNRQASNLENQSQRDFVRNLDLSVQMAKNNFETDQYRESVREAEELGAIHLVTSTDKKEIEEKNKATMKAFVEYMEGYENKTTQSSEGVSGTASGTIGNDFVGKAEASVSAQTQDTTTSQSITYTEYAQGFWSTHEWYVYKPTYKANYSRKSGE